MPQSNHTIIAIASPPGASPCGILRLSGPRAIEITSAIFSPQAGPQLTQRNTWCAVEGEITTAFELPRITSGKTATQQECRPCPCLVYLMRAPGSYTGEDVVELQVPGSTPLLHACLRTFIVAGARIAGPGEFTMRAFLNGRIDLGQAESVERIISARNEIERKQAMARLSSRLGREISAWKEDLLQCAAKVEVGLDFAENELDEDTLTDLHESLVLLCDKCAALAGKSMSEPGHDGCARVRLVGLTNAGKSSLVNALIGRKAIMISSQANTTRDWLEFPLALAKTKVMLQDSAGQDPAGTGMVMAAAQRSLKDIAELALVCLVVDLNEPKLEQIEPWLKKLGCMSIILVLNKSDLVKPELRAQQARALHHELARMLASHAGARPLAMVSTSAQTGNGLDDLRAALDALLVVGNVSPATNMVSARESAQLAIAAQACARARDLLKQDDALELVAEELRLAHASLGHALGEGYGQAVLNSIFSRFCVGK